RLLVDRSSPQVHAAAAVADKVEVLAVRRPDRVPVEVGGVGDKDRPATGTGNGPDPPPAGAGGHPPIDDAPAVRRPARLYGIAAENEPASAGRHLDAPDFALGPPGLRTAHPFGRDQDLLAVGRPRRVIAEVGQAADRLAGGPHEENAAARELRAEGD